MMWLAPAGVQAQDLIRQYSEARFRARVQELLETVGMKIVPKSIPVFETEGDSVTVWANRANNISTDEIIEPLLKPLLSFDVISWRKAEPFERHWFTDRFKGVQWTSEGMYPNTVLDTVSTRILRGKLESLFGAPSNTITDIMKERRPRGSEYIQFEYWFILNDSIPLIVLDVDGPFERGLVFAGDLAYKDLLPEAKRALVNKVMNARGMDSYVDYYFSYDQGVWFRTGFDGGDFFVERIQTPNIQRGRPKLPSGSR